jgi:glutathione S-transferase
MRLYSIDLSPFAARVRAAIYFKGLTIECVPPPAAGTRCAQYLALNPMGRLPALELDDGTIVPESETIIEYLEDAFPDPALRPRAAADRARVRLLSRVLECYVTAPMFLLFPQLGAAPRDTKLVEAQWQRIDDGLGYLCHYLEGDRYAFGTRLTSADCCLFPTLYLVDLIAPRFNRADTLAKHPKVAAYYREAQADPILHRVLDEMDAGMKAAGHA